MWQRLVFISQLFWATRASVCGPILDPPTNPVTYNGGWSPCLLTSAMTGYHGTSFSSIIAASGLQGVEYGAYPYKGCFSGRNVGGCNLASACTKKKYHGYKYNDWASSYSIVVICIRCTTHDGECVETCPEGFAANRTKKICQVCQDTDKDDCAKCTGFVWSGSRCETTCANFECSTGYVAVAKNGGSTTVTKSNCCETTCAAESFNCPAGYALKSSGSTTITKSNCCDECPAGHMARDGIPPCLPLAAYMMSQIAAPTIHVSHDGFGVVAFEATLAILPTVYENFSYGYSLDIATTAANLTPGSECSKLWHNEGDTWGLKLSYSELAGPCALNVTNEATAILRVGAIGVHIVVEGDGETAVGRFWIKPVALHFSRETITVSEPLIDINSPTLINESDINLSAFSSNLTIFRNDKFEAKKVLPFFVAGEHMFLQHALWQADPNLRLEVVLVWLTNDGIVTHNQTAVARYGSESDKASFSINATSCPSCYLHCLSRVSDVHGRRLSNKPLHVLETIYLEISDGRDEDKGNLVLTYTLLIIACGCGLLVWKWMMKKQLAYKEPDVEDPMSSQIQDLSAPSPSPVAPPSVIKDDSNNQLVVKTGHS